MQISNYLAELSKSTDLYLTKYDLHLTLTYKKSQPKIINYRSYKYFNSDSIASIYLLSSNTIIPNFLALFLVTEK